MDKADEALAKSVTDEAIARQNDLGPLGIRGLEEEDASVLPIPYVRVVQPTSKDTTMANKQDAPVGFFLFNDTQEAVQSLDFCLIKSKKVVVEFERDGVKIPTHMRKLLGVTVDTEKVFILSLAVTSFQNFGKLVARLKDAKAGATWEYMVHATTEKQENDKGKYWVVKLDLGEKLLEADQKKMAAAFGRYASALDPQARDGMPF